MAQPQQPGRGQRTVPDPPNWGRMTAGQKREWNAKHRPGQQPAPGAARPAGQPVAGQPDYQAGGVGGEEQGGEQGQEQPGEQYQGAEQVPPPGMISDLAGQLAGMDGRKFLAALLRGVADHLEGETDTF